MRLPRVVSSLGFVSALVLLACTPTSPDGENADVVAASSDPVRVWTTLSGERPDVIGHRGAPGLMPEHSSFSYEVAIEAGADIIEPDLQVSADGVLIVRHDPYLSTSTDIADRAEFADRRTTRFGREDWWVADLTADEIVTLRTRQVFADRDQTHNGQSPVLTFEGFLELIEQAEAGCGCTLAIEPEVKQPAAYAAAGLDPLPILLAALDRHGLNRADAPIVIQSFDAAFLQRLDAASEVRLAMLVEEAEPDSTSPDRLSLEEIARFAEVVGPHKGLLLTPDGQSAGYVEAAHALGLIVHTWTVRDDRPPLVGDSVEDELRALYALGVDGVFADFPATALRVRDAMAAEAED